jgi:isoquinoline 1-oxidoreductase beta subunit
MPPRSAHSTRRAFLVGGGLGVGLLLAWEFWPREYRPNLALGPGETALGAFLKIDTAGRVTVIVPQAELGQGIWTALAQVLADELGADWRQVGVEPAPVNPLYANRLLPKEWAEEAAPAWARDMADWAAERWATDHALMVTAGSTSVRAFEGPFRAAGATARALLCMAAGKRVGADWRACDTEEGFVTRGADRFRFGELAVEAAGFTPPSMPPLRRPGEGGIAGEPLSRLDAPAKIDGTLRYAGDVRLPGMVYAAIRHGPAGDSRLAGQDMAVADGIAGVVGVVRAARWIAVLAQTGWAAERALERMVPRFATAGALADSAAMGRSLDAALGSGGTRLVTQGQPSSPIAGPGTLSATYDIAFAAHAALEPLTATARVSGDRLEVWMPSQAPGLHGDAIARATGYAASAVVLYPTPAGGGFGHKLEGQAGVEAALLAIEAKRPVQLTWSRGEDLRAGFPMPPAKAQLSARMAAGGRLAAWTATVAMPSPSAVAHRLIPALPGGKGADRAALDGLMPPYAVPDVALAHAPVELPVTTGAIFGGAHTANAFFSESFTDELAATARLDPLSFRMGLLSPSPRLARCLTQAAAAGGWSGEEKSGQGLACHSAFGSHIALLAEAGLEGGALSVKRLVAVVDCGRVINPDIVTQQIEGGLIWGLGLAMDDALTFAAGLPQQHGLADLHLPRLADAPEIEVQIIPSDLAPGGVGELGVPVAAPAIANALFSATGKRLRSLPFLL